jgi:hypothetical protein
MTTLSPEGVPNAAPIGLHKKYGKIFARIYTSNTLDNILRYPKAAANIVDDPVLFVKSALLDIEFEQFKFVDDFPVLKNAQGWIIFDCKCKCNKGENISVVGLHLVKGKIITRKIKPVNRGFNAIIEALVHATRFLNLKDKIYLEKIDYYNTIIQKCGGAREKEAIHLLYELIESENKSKLKM